MKNIAYQHTPIGLVKLTEKEGTLLSLEFVKFQKQTEEPSLLLQEAKWQLADYFEGKRKSFNLPLHFECSTFHKEVYAALLNVPYGSTLSYKELATLAGNPEASRAVGTAMSHNPFPIIVPCHRVLKSDGSLGSYTGAKGIESKQWLLEHEKVIHLRK